MRYKVVHRTGFRYSTDVAASYNEVRMLPTRDVHQTVLGSKLEIHPHPASHEHIDYFGTRVVTFEVLEPHTELEITAQSTIEVLARETQDTQLSWSELAIASSRSLELADALLQTKRTNPPADLVKRIAKLTDTLTPSQAAAKVLEFIHSSLTYQTGSTQVHSLAAEVWSSKRGVCQDYAHLAIGALRHIGVPARYVSGYLHPHLEPKLGQKVVGESHAWIEWWDGSWHESDPTNSVEVSQRHIRVGTGRDYDDVPPLRGVYSGGTSSELFVSVEISREA